MKVRFLVLTSLVCLSSLALRGQGFGTIVGTVTDPSGAFVASAKITITNQGTSQSRETTTNAEGYFVVPSLQPATYDVKVEGIGFAPSVQKNVLLAADQTLTVNTGLSVQKTSTEVDVSASPVEVDTSTSTISQVVDQTRIVELPLNGRNAAQLTQLVSGAVSAPSNNADQGIYKTFPAAVTTSVNGSRANGMNFTLDGANNTDNLTNVNQPFPFPDALQEFSVQTSNYSAKYGGTAGGFVNIVSKSGANEIHGDLFEFNRNQVFNARNFFASRVDQLKRNQFGGTIGGPVIIPGLYNGKDKSFFFFGYQGTRLRNVQNGLTAYVPTAAEANGDFSALLNPSDPANLTGKVTQIVGANGAPLLGNRIPAQNLDPAAVNFLKRVPQGTGSGRIFYNQPLSQDFNEYFGRLDHSLSTSDRISGHYFLDLFTNRAYLDPANLINSISGSSIASHNALISETHVFQANLLNELRVSLARVSSVGGPPTNAPNLADLGVNMFQPSGPKTLDGINVSGFFSLSLFPPAYWYRNTYGVSDDVSWVKGKHNVAFGGRVWLGQTIMRDNFLMSGSFTFTGDATSYALASFLQGRVRTLQQGNGETKDNRNWFPSLYVQDDYHVTKRLTLNLGLRWDPFFPWTEIRNRSEQFTPALYYAGVKSTVYRNAPAGLLFPGDPNVPQAGARSDWLNFAPRVGFAWDVLGDGRTSIRGGAGSFYDAIQSGEWNNTFVNVAPFSPQLSVTDLRGSFSNPYLGLSVPFPAPTIPTANAPFPAPVLAVTYDPSNNAKQVAPVTYNWNFSIEHQFGAGWLLRSAYVGARTNHQSETIELNPATYIAGSSLATDARRLFQPYGSIGQSTQDIDSTFHSLQTTLQHRFAYGFQFLVNYTWSKSLDDMPYGQGINNMKSNSDSPVRWTDPGRHNMDYGRSDFDRAHVFILSYTWDSPKLSNTNKLVRYALGSWQLTGIVTAQTGQPLTVLAGIDASKSGMNTDRAQFLSSNTYGGNACGFSAPCVNFLNKAAFTTPVTGSYGNVGKGSLTGPGFVNWDTGVFKRIPVGLERLNIQFRAEFFNVLNHANFNNPSTSYSSASFGTILTARDPRIGQLALKVLF
jgi:hypothetical protein